MRMKSMWTYKEALKYLSEIRTTLAKHGYEGSIIGSVEEQGHSTHDLDIELIPKLNHRHQLHRLARALNAELMEDFPVTMEVIVGDKIVDFVIGDPE